MSGYQPPSASTLSAALDSENAQIAPELMGAEGMPPLSSSHRGQDYDPGNPGGYGSGFASSAARDEGHNSGHNSWGSYASSGRNMHPWEEGYRDESYLGGVPLDEPKDEEATEEQRGRKRPRASKPRASKGKEDVVDILDGSAEVEYEDPSHDYKMGPVFVHPPAGTAQACVRCHRIKRKCDNAKPRCAGCGKADVPCVYELNSATSNFVHHLKSDNVSLSSQIASAHERVTHLEAVVAALEKGMPRPASPAQDLQYDSSDPSGTDFPALARTILSVRGSTFSAGFGAVSMDALQSDRRDVKASSLFTGSEATLQQPLPPYQVAREAIDKFFIGNAISYPFLDRTEFLKDMDDLYARADASNRVKRDDSTDTVQQGKEFIIFMVIALGTTNKERLGEVERGYSKQFKQRALASFGAAVAREDILCMQALILLGIYSTFEPSGFSLWHVLGFAARIATDLNLHRRVDDASLPLTVVEQRRRIFYSFYNLDRLVATTLSRPLAISDSDIDVELPEPLPTDSPYRGVPSVHYTRHIIKLRRLAGAIMSTVYSVSGPQNNLPEPDRAGIINDLHSRLDSWLAESPIPPSDEEEKRGMINNHSWFLVNYQNCLCLLYRPSPLYPVTSNERLRALHEASSRCVDLFLELWHEQKISYNIINVSSQFLACISLLYCLCEYDNRSPNLVSDENWRREVTNRVSQCHELLEAFGRALPETAKYREIFGKLSEMLLARHGPVGPPASQGPSSTTETPIVAQPAIPLAPIIDTNAAVNFDAIPLKSPAITSPSFFRNGEAPTKQQAAWNAMTQLWHNSGDFNFDEAIFGQIHDDRLSGLMGADLSGVDGESSDRLKDAEVDTKGSTWSAEMLWNQLG